MKEALRDLLQTVETVATETGVVSGLVDTITASMNQMESKAQTVNLFIYLFFLEIFCPIFYLTHNLF